MKLSVRVDQQTYEVEIKDLSARPVLAVVDGETFEVWPEETGTPAAARPAAGLQTAPVNPTLRAQVQPPDVKSKGVPAPIPGVILSVAVKAGDTVVFGQELCVLEAMKMKNQIRANRAGQIAGVRVAPGEQVRHGQMLIEFAD